MKFFSTLILSLSAIIVFAQEQLAPTETEALVKVNVTTKDGTPQVGEKVQFKSTKDGNKQVHTSNAEGKFDILLPKGGKYEVDVLTFGDEGESASVFTVPDVEGQVVLNYTIYTTTVNTFLLDIQFNTNEATLQTESYKALDEFYDLLNAKKETRVEIGGHTDNVGDDKSNLALSEKRAKAVKDYLVQKGIAADRIIAKGYGESTPVATNDTPEGRQQNRRTEVKFIQE